MTAIRDSESLISWEVLGNATRLRTVNSNQLSTFRWPFFAYATAQNKIAINALSKKQFLAHHELELNSEEDK